MFLYCFKTNNTSYYFPASTKSTRFFFCLYTPYRFMVAVYWKLWRMTPLLRTKIRIDELPFPLGKIRNIESESSIMAFNMGTPGIHQKISILGFTPQKQQRFFAKYAEKKDAMDLSKKEIEVLRKYKSSGFVPQLYQTVIKDDFVFFKTEYIEGQKVKSIGVDDSIFNLLLRMMQVSCFVTEEGLLNCFSHGDFCPWNILNTPRGYQVIDWETAEDRVLGYDLFTYIFQTAFLLTPNESIESILNKNKERIDDYFALSNVKRYKPYLHAFAIQKVEWEELKEHDGYLVHKYRKIVEYADTL